MPTHFWAGFEKAATPRRRTTGDRPTLATIDPITGWQVEAGAQNLIAKNKEKARSLMLERCDPRELSEWRDSWQ